MKAYSYLVNVVEEPEGTDAPWGVEVILEPGAKNAKRLGGGATFTSKQDAQRASTLVGAVLRTVGEHKLLLKNLSEMSPVGGRYDRKN